MPSPEISQGSDNEMAARENAYNLLTRTSGSSGPGSAQASTVGTSAVGTKDSDKPSRGRKRLSFRPSHSHSNSASSYSRMPSRASFGGPLNTGPVTLPDDLEQVLTVISSGILEGHIKQVTALRKRYDEQFPLVRSLADVFTSNVSWVKIYVH